MYSKGFGPLAIATVVALATSLSLVFFYAPIDADQGFVQKIFYVRADDRGDGRLDRGGTDGHQAPAQRRQLLGRPLLRGHPPVDHPRPGSAGDRLDGPGPRGATGGCGRSRCS